MTKHDVAVAGGGPVGLMLACELALAGVDVAIMERRPDQHVAQSRAGGLHARALEELDQRGVADRFISLGKTYPVVMFPDAVLDASDMPTRRNYSLRVSQREIERLLAEWAEELEVKFYRESEVAGFTQDKNGIDVDLADGRAMRAKYLAGCDGGRSLVRKQAGIAFPGWDADISYLIFEGEMTEGAPEGIRHSPRGIVAIGKTEDGKRLRGVVTENTFKQGDEPDIDDLREALISAYGKDFGVHSVTWLSRFTDAARQAAQYRKGRVLLAGDAAHVHSPTGGQGLNVGLQDSVNLGWKLAQVVKGVSPERLLDSYHAERHPAAARVLKHTLAITALSRGDARTNALREMLPEVMRMEGPRKWYGAKMYGLDIRHDLGDGHPLLGRRMPDLDLVTADGAIRVFSLLHEARPVLINLGERGALDIAAWADRVQLVDATHDGAWEVPVIGIVSAPSAVLVRPDGYVAWVGEGAQAGLSEALTTWFGPPA